MRIRLSQLRQIIKEEVSRVMNEAPNPKHKAFRDLSGTYDFLKNKAVEDIINPLLEKGKEVYDLANVMGTGNDVLDIQVQRLVNGAVKLGAVKLGQGRLKPIKSFADVGDYIDNNPELAKYTKDEIAGHEQADRVYPPLRR